MSLDPQSLELLKKLGRELPQRINEPIKQPEIKPQSKKLQHQVETEDNPQALFHELMKASSDGKVPPHLMNRLKSLEAKQLSQKQFKVSNQTNNQNQHINQSSESRLNRSKLNINNDVEALYATFKELLLEDEI